LLPWTEVFGADPVYLFEPLDTLPDATGVSERLHEGAYVKVVALVGYRTDAEASEVARHLPYGPHGEGIEEIVFARAVPIARTVEFEDDAWPGEDRTYVLDDVPGALELINRFAVEHGAENSAILVTGHAGFVDAVHARLTADD
jgi:hypothetical protein